MQSTNLETTNKEEKRSERNPQRKRKKKIKNAFFLCFQPVTMDGPVNPDSGLGDGNLGFKCISVKDKDGGVVFTNILPDSSSPSMDNKSASADAATPRKKRLGHRSFSRVLKALLFEASLVKKLRKRKLREKLNRSHPESSEKTVKNSKPPLEISMSNNPESNTNGGRSSISNSSSSLRLSSVITSTTLCSSCGSSLSDRNNSNRSFRLSSSEQRKMKDNINNVQEQGKGYYGVNFGLCLVVLSLVVLVFWGKVCAIFCTSTWLFFVPRRSIRSEWRNEGASEFDSEQYKKKIIMQGLLERNRIRSL
ncbi:hypothetical protein HS088_TW19G00203 [Tripterygium wilfordii]|uniref:Uncharacterized protein n=1 Tax=Tripterygium wilfordii TaxID=458696 RepID=A0A7J7C8Y5_TRIWF|nr:uncharacterized protein LOC119985881 [Tripterygium wilfordii]KAF5730611.1 hypothetical protein HS088_TW19G00203 [Tripterygium wilfordii]